MSTTSLHASGRLDATLSRSTNLTATHRLLMTQGRRTVARARWEMRRAANLRDAAPSDARPMYRVEHWLNHRVTDLGVLDGASGHHAALAPFTSFLRLRGRVEGEVVLIEAASNRVVARRAVAPAGRRVA